MNGSLGVNTTTLAYPRNISSSNFLGKNNYYGPMTQFQIDDFRIYNIGLNQSQITIFNY